MPPPCGRPVRVDHPVDRDPVFRRSRCRPRRRPSPPRRSALRHPITESVLLGTLRGSRRRIIQRDANDSARSADPALRDDAARPPCLIMVTPAPAAMSAARVERLIAPVPSPPVPAMSARGTVVGTTTALSSRAFTTPRSSAAVGPLACNAVRNPASRTLSALPSTVSRITHCVWALVRSRPRISASVSSTHDAAASVDSGDRREVIEFPSCSRTTFAFDPKGNKKGRLRETAFELVMPPGISTCDKVRLPGVPPVLSHDHESILSVDDHRGQPGFRRSRGRLRPSGSGRDNGTRRSRVCAGCRPGPARRARRWRRSGAGTVCRGRARTSR